LDSSVGSLGFERIKFTLSSSSKLLPPEAPEVFVIDENGSCDERDTIWKFLDIPDNMIVRLASEKITLKALQSYWRQICRYLDPIGVVYKDNPIFSGKVFEIVFQIMLHFEQEFQAREIGSNAVSSLKIVGNATTYPVGDDWVDFYFQTSKMNSDTLNVDVRRRVAIPETSNQPNVDMMDKCNRGFQLTTSGGHSIKERFLWKQLICNYKIGQNNLLKLYFVTIDHQKISS